MIEATQVDVVDLQVGDCVSGVEGGESVAVEAVPCRSPTGTRCARGCSCPTGGWPGPKAGAGEAERRCAESFFFVPSEDSWRQDDRVVTCIAR